MLILGAGSQAKVVADIAQAAGIRVTGFIELGMDPGRAGQTLLGSPVLASISPDTPDAATKLKVLAGQHAVKNAALAIGDNVLREKLYSLAVAAGLTLPILTHPSAVVSPSAVIGAASVIAAMAVVGVEARVSEGCIINTSASVDHDCGLGPFVHVAVGAHLAGAVKVGGRSLIGAGATVIPEVEIGHDSIVGAGACVVGNLPAGCLALGVPAKVVN